MKFKMMTGAAVLAALPFAAFAQDVPKEPEYAGAAIDASLHQPMSQLPLTGTPNGIPLMTSHNSTDKPPFQMIEGKSNIAIASATLDEKAAALNDVKVIYRVAPALDERMQMANEGGRIAMARDGSLFVIIGDRSKSPPWLVADGGLPGLEASITSG
jgi:hypothetical protein